MITEKNAAAVNNTGSEVKSYGVVMSPQMFKVFYSSLYEDKETAVLREVAANGLDSHTVAGIPHVPIVITLPNSIFPTLVIQDFGVGMSLDDLENTFTIYGKSSKGGSNDEIGGFGYGAKSPFSISDTFTVESVKDGMLTVLVNYIDEDGPKYLVTKHENTDLPNGTKVIIPVAEEETQKRLESKVKGDLFSVWPVPPVVKGGSTSIEITPIKPLKQEDSYFAFETTEYIQPHSVLSKVTVGPFIYRLPLNMASRLNSEEVTDFIASVYKTSRSFSTTKSGVGGILVVPSFQIGDLELSPSRERIEDTPENYAKIVSVLKTIESNILKVDPLSPVEQIKLAHNLDRSFGRSLKSIVGVGDDIPIYLEKPQQILNQVFNVEDGTTIDVVTITAAITSFLKSAPYSYNGCISEEEKVEVSSLSVSADHPFRSLGYRDANSDYTPVYFASLVQIIANCLQSEDRKKRAVENAFSSYCKFLLKKGVRYSRASTHLCMEHVDNIVLVPESLKPRVSRLLNAGILDVKRTLVVFNPVFTVEEFKVALGKLQKFCGEDGENEEKTIKILAEEEIKDLFLKLPKKSSSSSTNATKQSTKKTTSTTFFVGYKFDFSKHRFIEVTNVDLENDQEKKYFLGVKAKHECTSLTYRTSLEPLFKSGKFTYYTATKTQLKQARVQKFWEKYAEKNTPLVVSLVSPSFSVSSIIAAVKDIPFVKESLFTNALSHSSLRGVEKLCSQYIKEHFAERSYTPFSNYLSLSKILKELDSNELRCKWYGFSNISFSELGNQMSLDDVFNKTEKAKLKKATLKVLDKAFKEWSTM